MSALMGEPVPAAAPCTLCGSPAAYGPCPLSLKCPTCQARPGVKCRRPSGHDCQMHVTRFRLAEKDLPVGMREG